MWLTVEHAKNYKIFHFFFNLERECPRFYNLALFIIIVIALLYLLEWLKLKIYAYLAPWWYQRGICYIEALPRKIQNLIWLIWRKLPSLKMPTWNDICYYGIRFFKRHLPILLRDPAWHFLCFSLYIAITHLCWLEPMLFCPIFIGLIITKHLRMPLIFDSVPTHRLIIPLFFCCYGWYHVALYCQTVPFYDAPFLHLFTRPIILTYLEIYIPSPYV